MNKLYFARENNEIKIPSKRDEDAGYDIYAYFIQDFIVIPPHVTAMIPTGLRSAFDKKWYVQLQERGSTGTKGIAQRCGVIDSGYRGEWMIPITNVSNKHLIISKLSPVDTINEIQETFNHIDKNNSIIYPYEKAICQAVVIEVPKLEVNEISVDEILDIKSTRGEGKLGSSSK